MPNISLSLLFFLAIVSYSFYLEVEDTSTNREGNVWGKVKLTHHERDNKLILILEGADMHHYIGEPPLTLEDIDVMHEIGHHLHRFEPEQMKELKIPNDNPHIVVLTYQSRKAPNWIYRFHFSPQVEEEATKIREFMSLYQRQEPIDLLAQVPEELRAQLEQEQRRAVEDLAAKQEL